mmetsp:Transcript_32505/g.58819  ORF Transcript_32505/g.58819 Transcript_32505/m.58819 type:complete len:159 (-) Transcript_32505:1032-1508(-)
MAFSTKKEKATVANDLADPLVILNKLQQLRQAVQEKTGEILVDLPWYKLHDACFLSLFHLHAEIRQKHPDHREKLYSASGDTTLDKETSNPFANHVGFYAHWALLISYTELADLLSTRDYQVLRRDTATEPGRVGHYIAINYAEKTCLIGLKGTSTFS